MLKKLTTFPMPETGLMIKTDLSANQMIKCYRTTQSERQKNVVNIFGTPVIVIAKLWELIH